MNKKILINFVLLFFIVYLTGCDCVKSTQLVGERTQEDLSKQFNGVWDFDASFGYVKFLQKGELRLAGVDWENNNFHVSRSLAIITECGDKKFINFKDPEIEEGEGLEYFFMHYSFIAENQLIMWLPKSKIFQKAVSEKVLKGKMKKVDFSTVVSINEPKGSLCGFIQDKGIEEVFDLEEPIIIEKIKELNGVAR